MQKGASQFETQGYTCRVDSFAQSTRLSFSSCLKRTAKQGERWLASLDCWVLLQVSMGLVNAGCQEVGSGADLSKEGPRTIVWSGAKLGLKGCHAAWFAVFVETFLGSRFFLLVSLCQGS